MPRDLRAALLFGKTMAAKRKGLSKRTRFRVLARDGFRCRYCGRGADIVTLVVDHVVAVANGGTNDDANLIAACDECNSGKSAERLAPLPRTLGPKQLRSKLSAQRKMIARIESTRAIQSEMRQNLVDAWCGITGRDTVSRQTMNVMVSFAQQHGVEKVLEWVQKAYDKGKDYSDTAMGKYVSGIRRIELAGGFDAYKKANPDHGLRF